MRTIHKYPFILSFEVQEIELPIHAALYGIVVQFNDPLLYAEVEDDVETEKRRFQLLPTGGNLVGEYLSYIDSFFLPNDLFVGHFYELL